MTWSHKKGKTSVTCVLFFQAMRGCCKGTPVKLLERCVEKIWKPWRKIGLPGKCFCASFQSWNKNWHGCYSCQHEKVRAGLFFLLFFSCVSQGDEILELVKLRLKNGEKKIRRRVGSPEFFSHCHEEHHAKFSHLWKTMAQRFEGKMLLLSLEPARTMW